LQETIMDGYQAGTQVNLEVDLIARYLERLMMGEEAGEMNAAGVTEALLMERGFIKGR
ncbi:MAG: riboflavin synthase, partial [Candidatus Thiodiazotropha taylori]|nr:riboflavin synthase [Candidatus Thiodiazotropha taylori]MCW4251744.1 riboflavin synthase [Candidatus Thiodiazotropha taylori]